MGVPYLDVYVGGPHKVNSWQAFLQSRMGVWCSQDVPEKVKQANKQAHTPTNAKFTKQACFHFSWSKTDMSLGGGGTRL